MLFGAAILSVALLAIASFFQNAYRMSAATRAQVQSGYLLEEGVEAIKLIRDSGYANGFGKLSTTTTYYLSWATTTSRWATTTTNTYIDGKYERKFTVADVRRDGQSQDIVTAGGVYDVNAKKVTMTVSWKDSKGATSTRSIATYMFNLFNN